MRAILGLILSCLFLPSGTIPQTPPSGLEVDAGMPVPYRPEARYSDMVRFSRYLTMRDGVKIAVDVTLPASLKPDEKLPAILVQTRYWRSFAYPAGTLATDFQKYGRYTVFKKLFLSQGYAWVDVDTRGSGASYGCRLVEFSPDEVRDGAEVVDWIVRQPWSDGKVGTTGISYDGTAAELLLVNRHPAVKAAAPLFSLFDIYTDIVFPGGIPMAWFVESWSGLNAALDGNSVPESLRAVTTGVRLVDEDRDGSMLAAAVREHTANVAVFRQLSGLACRDDAPDTKSITSIDVLSPHSRLRDLASSGAAIYSVSGWFDGAYQHAAIKRFLSLPNPGHRLLLGPWPHAGEYDISPFSDGRLRFDLGAELLKFFDYHLKGLDTGIRKENRVHYFTMGEEKWKTSDTWPPSSRPAPFYFHARTLLSSEPPRDFDAADNWRVNLTSGTGNHTRWNSLLGMFIFKPYPDRAEQDANLLCYTTMPLAKEVEISGHPIAKLHISSSASDGTFFVYLEDIDEKNRVTYVTEGELRALHRRISDARPPYAQAVPYRSFRRTDAQPLQPDEVAEIQFDLLPTSYLFKKGHRIRIALAGSDKDHFDVLPQGTVPIVRVHRNQKHASAVFLPIIER